MHRADAETVNNITANVGKNATRAKTPNAISKADLHLNPNG